jgi:flagellar biosynthesis chaperone FliJ
MSYFCLLRHFVYILLWTSDGGEKIKKKKSPRTFTEIEKKIADKTRALEMFLSTIHRFIKKNKFKTPEIWKITVNQVDHVWIRVSDEREYWRLQKLVDIDRHDRRKLVKEQNSSSSTNKQVDGLLNKQTKNDR